jgi:hypothetical protein
MYLVVIMASSGILRTEDLKQYSEWLDDELVGSWMKCVEYLLKKHLCNNFIIKHKKLLNGEFEEIKVNIQIRDSNTSKVTNTIQNNEIVEQAGIAMGLLVSLLIRPCRRIRVLKLGEGYDYRYLPMDSQDEELIEMTGTEVPNGGEERLNTKIRKFKMDHPLSSGYISVSCFHDKIQMHWGHKN